jgi:hypothetical protein
VVERHGALDDPEVAADDDSDEHTEPQGAPDP